MTDDSHIVFVNLGKTFNGGIKVVLLAIMLLVIMKN